MKNKTYKLIENISDSILNAFPYLTAKEHSEVMENFIYNSLKKNLMREDDERIPFKMGRVKRALKDSGRTIKGNTEKAMKAANDKVEKGIKSFDTYLSKKVPELGDKFNKGSEDFRQWAEKNFATKKDEDMPASKKLKTYKSNYAADDFDPDSYAQNAHDVEQDYQRYKRDVLDPMTKFKNSLPNVNYAVTDSLPDPELASARTHKRPYTKDEIFGYMGEKARKLGDYLRTNSNYAATDFDSDKYDRVMGSKIKNFAGEDFDPAGYEKNSKAIDRAVGRKLGNRLGQRSKGFMLNDFDPEGYEKNSKEIENNQKYGRNRTKGFMFDDLDQAGLAVNSKDIQNKSLMKNAAMIAALAGTTIAGGIALYKKYGPSVVKKIQKEASPSMLEKAKSKFKSFMKKIKLAESTVAKKSHRR